MTSESVASALSLVKLRLNRLDAALDDYLTARIHAACEYLENQGIHLDTEAAVRDLMLVVDTAVYQYSNRDSATGVPDWLRYQIRQRWLMERGDQS